MASEYSVWIAKKLSEIDRLEDMDQFNDVRKLCSEVIKEDPCCSKAYLARGRISFREGNISEGFRDFDRVIELGPDLPGAYLIRARKYLEHGKFVAALSDAEKIVELAEEFYLQMGYFYVAIALLALGQPDRAKPSCLKLRQDFNMYVSTPEKERCFYSRSDLLMMCDQNVRIL